MSTSALPQPDVRCLSCQQPLVGRYCAECGQSAGLKARITINDLVHDIPHSIWHVDHGVLYTLRELLLRPGDTLRRYLAGERSRFFRPLTLLLLLGGLATFLMAAFHLDYLPQKSNAGATASEREMAQGMAEVSAFIYKYFSWFTIAMLPVYAWLSWMLLRRLRLHYAEHLLVNAFLLSAALLVQIGLLPLFKLIPSHSQLFKILTFTEQAVLPLYQAWALNQLARPAYVGGGRVARAVLIAFLGLILSGIFVFGLAWGIIQLRG